MLVSHSHRFIYLKGFKVGGTSTEVFFQPVCQPPARPVTHANDEFVGPEGIVGYRGARPARDKTPNFANHMGARQLRDALPPEVWSEYFKFANVRNPFNAVLSGVLQLRRAASGGPICDEAELLTRLDDALNRGSFNDSATFIKRQRAVDDVIRFEDIEDETRRIAAIVGFETSKPIPHLKKYRSALSGRAPAEFFTPTRTAKLVARAGHYFDAFGYSTDPYDAPPFPAFPAVRKKDQVT